MTPATHTAVGAVCVAFSRRPGLGLAAAFVSHFFLDWLFHFEAFYPLSRALGTDHRTAAIVTTLAIVGFLAPVAYRLGRDSRELLVFCVFVFAQTLSMVDPRWWPRLVAGGSFTTLAVLYRRESPFAIWYVAGWVANLPDVLKRASEPFQQFHSWVHYEGRHDMGDWLYRLVKGGDIAIPLRFEDSLYVTGYALELALELGLLVGSLMWLKRLSEQENSTTSPLRGSETVRGQEDTGDD